MVGFGVVWFVCLFSNNNLNFESLRLKNIRTEKF